MSSGSPNQKGPPKVLMVCPPNEIDAKTMEFVASIGYSIEHMIDVKEAVPKMMGSDIDFLIMTIPSRTSKEFKMFQLLRTKLKKKVGVVSGSNDPKLVSACLGKNAEFFINFPVSRNRLAILLSRHLPLAQAAPPEAQQSNLGKTAQATVDPNSPGQQAFSDSSDPEAMEPPVPQNFGSYQGASTPVAPEQVEESSFNYGSVSKKKHSADSTPQSFNYGGTPPELGTSSPKAAGSVRGNEPPQQTLERSFTGNQSGGSQDQRQPQQAWGAQSSPSAKVGFNSTSPAGASAQGTEFNYTPTGSTGATQDKRNGSGLIQGGKPNPSTEFNYTPTAVAGAHANQAPQRLHVGVTASPSTPQPVSPPAAMTQRGMQGQAQMAAARHAVLRQQLQARQQQIQSMMQKQQEMRATLEKRMAESKGVAVPAVQELEAELALANQKLEESLQAVKALEQQTEKLASESAAETATALSQEFSNPTATDSMVSPPIVDETSFYREGDSVSKESILESGRRLCGKIWVDRNVKDFVIKLARFYDSRVSILVAGRKSQDAKVVMDSSAEIPTETGMWARDLYGEQALHQIQDSFKSYFESKRNRVMTEMDQSQVRFAIPLFQNRSFASMLFLAAERNRVTESELFDLFFGSLDLGYNLRDSVIGKQRLVDVYLSFYRAYESSGDPVLEEVGAEAPELPPQTVFTSPKVSPGQQTFNYKKSSSG